MTRRRRAPRESAVAGTQVVFPRPDSGAARSDSGASRLDSGASRLDSGAGPRLDRRWRRIAARRPGAPDDLEEPLRSPQFVDEPAGAPVTIPLLPGEPTPARRLKFGVVNGCTVGSLLLGMVGVFLAINGELRLAAIALLACVIFDGCDGGLARRFGVASPFGAQMDSLADLSSFGAATGIVVYLWLVAEGASPFAAAPASALILVCAAIRLARFNVSPKDGRFFCGVPTTMAAAVLALNMLIGPHLPAGAQVAVVMVYALAMVTSFPYAKLSQVLRLPMWLWVLPAICAMISVPGTFAAVVGGYLISGPLLWLYHNRRRPLNVGLRRFAG